MLRTRGVDDNIRTWLQEELEALRNQAETLKLMPLTQGDKAKLKTCAASISRIYDTAMRDSYGRLRERRAEIDGGVYDDPLESLQHLNDCVHIVEELMRSVIGLRIQTVELWSAYVKDPED